MEPTEIRFRRAKTGEWVISGPADAIEAAVVNGTKLTVHRKNGPPRHLVPLRAGKRFTEDGVEKCYGYTSVQSEPEPAARCGTCDFLLPPDARFCPRCGESVSSNSPTISDPRGVSDSAHTHDFETEGVR